METTPPRTDDRGICYGSGQIVPTTFTDFRGILVGRCPECGREVGLKVARVGRPRQAPRCLNWHRPTRPRKPDLRSRAGRRRKVLVDG